jgi:hypothetical protein
MASGSLCMGSHRLTEDLGVTTQESEVLIQAGLVHHRPPEPRLKGRIDHEARKETYARMLAKGPFSDHRARPLAGSQQGMGEQGAEGTDERR